MNQRKLAHYKYLLWSRRDGLGGPSCPTKKADLSEYLENKEKMTEEQDDNEDIGRARGRECKGRAREWRVKGEGKMKEREGFW